MSVALKLSTPELQILVTWGYAIREGDGVNFSEAEQALLDKLKAQRDERHVLG